MRDASADIADCGDGNDAVVADSFDDGFDCEHVDLPSTGAPSSLTKPPATPSSPSFSSRPYSVEVRRGQTLTSLLKGGLLSTVNCRVACRVKQTLAVPRNLARRLHLSAARPVVIARTLGRRNTPGIVRLRLRVSRGKAKRLRSLKVLDVTLTTTVNLATGSATPTRKKPVQSAPSRRPRRIGAARQAAITALLRGYTPHARSGGAAAHRAPAVPSLALGKTGWRT